MDFLVYRGRLPGADPVVTLDADERANLRPMHIVRNVPVPKLVPIETQLPQEKPNVVIPYAPRDVFRPYHRRKQRFALTVAHRRCGKTVAEVNEGVKRIMTCPHEFPPPQAAFISPTYGQGKRNAWPYAKHYTSAIPGMKVMEGDLTLIFPNGGKYFFAGSDNYDSIRGTYFDHVSLDEFGTQDPRVWGQVVRPALSDRRGTATFIGSANGRNHFYDLMKQHEKDPDWLITILKASQTGILSDEELKDARQTMTDEQYRQEYECDFDAAVVGTVYGKEISLAEAEGRIRKVMHDRFLDVYCGWDLGKGANMGLWTFQVTPSGEWHFLENYSASSPDDGLDKAVDWVKSRPYRINEHFLPHDAQATELMNPDTTRKDFLEGRGLSCTVVPRSDVAEGIAMVQLKFNRFFFDETGCSRGVDSLRMYRFQFDETKKVFSIKPVHDWASHDADALRTCVMAAPEGRSTAMDRMPLRRGLKGIV